MIDIKALEKAVRDARAHPVRMNGVCMTADEAQEALDALERLEPVPAEELPRSFRCPVCKTRLAERTQDDCICLETDDVPKFCWMCGQAVMLDG